MNSPTPIQSLDKFDVVGVRKDGGIDLVISCSGPLDATPETLLALECKIRNYVREVEGARSPTFFEKYNCKPNAPITIFVSCNFEVHPKVMELIERMQSVAERIASKIEVRKQMGRP